MHRILYISTARHPLSPDELQTLLETSRRNNARCGLTGLLVVGGRRFLQALEGPHDAVFATYHRISQDPRHWAMVKLGDTAITERAFGDWSMGYQHGGEAADEGTLEDQINAMVAPITDKTLRAYFTGFAERHNMPQ